TYYGEGQVNSTTDRGNYGVSYTIDNDGRTTATSPGSSTSYDAAGRVSSTRTLAGILSTYGYDDAGRRTSVTDPLNHATTFAYDNAGNQTSVTDANNHTTRYEYDNAGHRTKV